MSRYQWSCTSWPRSYGPTQPLQHLLEHTDWFLESILVFGGDYTNPENLIEMVDVVLGASTRWCSN